LAPELLHELLQDLQELGRIILAAALAALAAALRHLLSQLRDLAQHIHGVHHSSPSLRFLALGAAVPERRNKFCEVCHTAALGFLVTPYFSAAVNL
jgi:hypothetical protein